MLALSMRPITVGDVKQIVVEFRKAVGTGKDAPKSQSVDILGWDFAFELNEIARQDAEKASIDLRLVRIPREVLDKRAVDQGDIRFFELAALSVGLKQAGRKVKMTLEDFIIPLDDVPADVQKAVTHWSQWIDYWAVDWDNKDDTFHNEWQAYRTTKSQDLALATEHDYAEPGEYAVVVKVIDILGNDTTKTMSVKVAVVARKAALPQGEQEDLLTARVTTAPCVPEIRKAVKEWRHKKYKGATTTTKTLFNYWFSTDHRRPDGQSFHYYCGAARSGGDACLAVRSREG